jgi:selenide,water dikinase
VAGGHSIDSPEPIYGLLAIGIVDPARVLRNNTAQAGDAVILSKPLGVGIYSAALKQGNLDASMYEEMLASMTLLNDAGAKMKDIAGVHSMTDVTGFGVLGHLLEMCHGSALGAEIRFEALPLLTQAHHLAMSGVGTGGAKRNWNSCGHEVVLPADAPEWWRGILCDPQTSGGLLIACSQESVLEVLDLLRNRTATSATVIGEISDQRANVQVR